MGKRGRRKKSKERQKRIFTGIKQGISRDNKCIDLSQFSDDKFINKAIDIFESLPDDASKELKKFKEAIVKETKVFNRLSHITNNKNFHVNFKTLEMYNKISKEIDDEYRNSK